MWIVKYNHVVDEFALLSLKFFLRSEILFQEKYTDNRSHKNESIQEIFFFG
jgi:hypothetical protein